MSTVAPRQGGLYQLRKASMCMVADPKSRSVSMGDCTSDGAVWKYDDTTKSWASVAPGAGAGNLFLSVPNNACDVALTLDASGPEANNLAYDVATGRFRKTDCDNACISAEQNYKGTVPHLASCDDADAQTWRVIPEAQTAINPLGSLLAPVLALLVVGFVYFMIQRSVKRAAQKQQAQASSVQRILSQLARQ